MVPFFSQYEDFAFVDIRWLPYVVFFNRGDYVSPALNTDSAGFRVSHGPEGPRSLQDAPPDGEVSVLLGSSLAFGLGASADERTIASLLGREPGGPTWLNLASPAFTSTQEAVLFLLHRHQLPAVRDVVVLSGVNNLVVAGLPEADSNYGQFFWSGDFMRKMGVPEQEEPQWTLGRLGAATRRIRQRRKAPDGAAAPRILSLEERVDLAVRTTVRDLARVCELAAPTGARVHFVLQPTLAWCGKRLSPEETALIEENDRERKHMWDLFNEVLNGPVYPSYGKRLERACDELRVPFVDANRALASSSAIDDWLFVDPVHLNDEGNRVVTEILEAELDIS
ncbi:SGNH/GDSL hydrolase family protein [Actinomadura chibensis]|uniref:SGNH/GDSL hydrolase family protein n=1 Tax=Actinomadura chibensis TaxID=392828 RepID=A0A5D0NCH6_9ACTN|nr:SGNH/GDSL hydrolase family protein [Actinomadura chibensis]